MWIKSQMANLAPGSDLWNQYSKTLQDIAGNRTQILNKDGSVNREWQEYYTTDAAAKDNLNGQLAVTKGYRENGAAKAGPIQHVTALDTNAIFDAARRHDISQYGHLQGGLSGILGSLHLSNGASYSARNEADYANASSNEANQSLKDAGLPLINPITPSGTPASTIFRATVMRQAAADMAAAKAYKFRETDSALTGKSKQFGNISQFNSDWNSKNPIENYMRTVIHRNGFIPGMTYEEKAQYLPILPVAKPPATTGGVVIDPATRSPAEKGLFNVAGNIVQIGDDHRIKSVLRKPGQ
jgi:hypothetical protein